MCALCSRQSRGWRDLVQRNAHDQNVALQSRVATKLSAFRGSDHDIVPSGRTWRPWVFRATLRVLTVGGANTCVSVPGCADDQACEDAFLAGFTCTGSDDNGQAYCEPPAFSCTPGDPCDGGYGTCNDAGDSCVCMGDEECTAEGTACNMNWSACSNSAPMISAISSGCAASAAPHAYLRASRRAAAWSGQRCFDRVR